MSEEWNSRTEEEQKLEPKTADYSAPEQSPVYKSQDPVYSGTSTPQTGSGQNTYSGSGYNNNGYNQNTYSGSSYNNNGYNNNSTGSNNSGAGYNNNTGTNNSGAGYNNSTGYNNNSTGYSNAQYGNQQYGTQQTGYGVPPQYGTQQTGYGVPPQYGYQGANGNNSKKKEGEGFGIASLVLGIISVLLFCTCINYVLAIMAIIFGIIQMATREKKGAAVGGIITSAISIIVASVFWIVLYGSAVKAAGGWEEFLEEYRDEYGNSSPYDSFNSPGGYDNDFDFDLDFDDYSDLYDYDFDDYSDLYDYDYDYYDGAEDWQEGGYQPMESIPGIKNLTK